MSIEGARELLQGWTVRRSADCHPPIAAAARILEQFGAEQTRGSHPGRASLRLSSPGRRPVDVQLCGWGGEGALRGALWPLGDVASVAPNGAVLTAYAALRLAGSGASAARHGMPARLSAKVLVSELLAATALGGPTRPGLVRCRDGWLVTRWRDQGEHDLFRALVGREGTVEREVAVAQARLARLLVGAVRRPPAIADLCLGEGTMGRSSRRDRRRRARVIDWTVLWAGPWAAQQLQCSGAHVQRIEHPRRRDGLLSWPEGRSWWRRLNQGKRVELLDARVRDDRARIDRAVGDADILVTSMTPRALRSLGVDERWRAEHAPGLLHIELVAFDDPWADSPGLGEHAAAEAGLLWRGEARPATPYPWADPILGATALALSRIWLASERRPGGRIRLTLQRAASLPFAMPERSRPWLACTSRQHPSAVKAAGNPA